MRASPRAMLNSMIAIDGSTGEGGGQVLRTALAMSLATGRPFRVENIRAGRSKPGLLRQHLTAVQAAAAIGDARVEGDTLGSRTLTFEPRTVRGGDYHFSVGSAGSATLVLQTVLPPLLLARERSTLTLEGGTHNPWAPPFDFLQRVFLPAVNRLGPHVEAELVRPGFYPAGGGRFTATIQPTSRLARLDLLTRGDIVARRVRALVANLPARIAEREVSTAARLLNWSDECGRVEVVADSPGPGNVVFVEVESEHATEICTGFGEIGKAAEAVADGPAKDVRRYLAAGVPVGGHLADQLLPILALGEGGAFRTLTLSSHVKTNIDVIKQFVDVRIDVTAEARDAVRIDVNREP
jgi:RNA 3'-terminal phosphate cyclase (ATP)